MIIEPCDNGTYEHIGAKGGTELMLQGLRERLVRCAPDLWTRFNVVCSRVRNLDATKPTILWLHDLAQDPENDHLSNKELRQRFAKLVYVSHFQQLTYGLVHGIPIEDTIVLKNAIVPIEAHVKPVNGPVNLIYHTTPHRGLELLIPAFEYIRTRFPELPIHLSVYSSFAAYGNNQRDAAYESLFQRCREHPDITYHGYQDNEVVRSALKQAHIYAYPNIWQETSGISVIEAMSAGCTVVCSNLGALPETCANFANMYGYHPDPNVHLQRFIRHLLKSIQYFWTTENQHKLTLQKDYIREFYTWDIRLQEWTEFLQSI